MPGARSTACDWPLKALAVTSQARWPELLQTPRHGGDTSIMWLDAAERRAGIDRDAAGFHVPGRATIPARRRLGNRPPQPHITGRQEFQR